MKNNSIKFLIAISCFFLSMSAKAYDFKVNGIYYNINSETELTVNVTGGDGSYEGNITIPEIVTSGNKSYNVTEIEKGTFIGCGQLLSITIPRSVTIIAPDAFGFCPSLKQFIVHAENTCYATKDGVLFNKDFTELILYPNAKSATYIIPGNVTIIGSFAFRTCNNLTSITIPNSVTTIGRSAFNSCIGLTSIIIPNGVITIGSHAFYNCYNLTSVSIPPTVKTIGDLAFVGCTNLASLNIPDGITSIGISTFNGCSSLTSITIPNSVNTIGNHAFSICTGLASVTLGNNITSMGGSVFEGCSALAKVYSLNSLAPAISDLDLPFEESAYASATLFIPIGSLVSYSSMTGWKEFVNIMEVDFSSIESANNDNVKVVTQGNEIIVNGIDENMLIEIYNMEGEQIYKGYDNTTAINTCGLYIVRIAEKTYKVML